MTLTTILKIKKFYFGPMYFKGNNDTENNLPFKNQVLQNTTLKDR